MCRWYMTCTDLTDARHPGDEQLAKEFVLHWHLGEEVVDFIIFTIYSVCPLPDNISKNKTGLCEDRREGRERERERYSISKENNDEDDSIFYRKIQYFPFNQTVFGARSHVTSCANSPLSQDVEYSVLRRDWDGEYLEIIGSLPKKL